MAKIWPKLSLTPEAKFLFWNKRGKKTELEPANRRFTCMENDDIGDSEALTVR